MKRELSIYSSIHPAGGVALSCPLVVRSDHCRALCLSGCLEKSRPLRRSLLNELAMTKIGSGVGFDCPLAAVSIVVASTCPVVPAAFPSLPLRGGRQTPEGPESEAPPGEWTNATQPKAESARLTRTQLQSFRSHQPPSQSTGATIYQALSHQPPTANLCGPAVEAGSCIAGTIVCSRSAARTRGVDEQSTPRSNESRSASGEQAQLSFSDTSTSHCTVLSARAYRTV